MREQLTHALQACRGCMHTRICSQQSELPYRTGENLCAATK